MRNKFRLCLIPLWIGYRFREIFKRKIQRIWALLETMKESRKDCTAAKTRLEGSGSTIMVPLHVLFGVLVGVGDQVERSLCGTFETMVLACREKWIEGSPFAFSGV